MKIIKSTLTSYLRVVLFYLLLFYLVTAPPTGPFIFKWNWANVYFTAAFFICYPWLIYLYPHLIRPRLKLTSQSTHALRQTMKDNQNGAQGYHNSLNPVVSRDRLLMKSETQDALMNSELSFLIQGILLLIAAPILLCLYLVKGQKVLRRHLN
ncbi:hypothetical protein [Lactiplantibacillus herbarum]|uniref:hypothetical protein n=1 Tax=Lactiplantibacillus herbarum TaxID=1670446 RepID=UPI00064EDC3C|nr:hypothetical protein [Lactiplantibacillus herbarum]